MYKIRTNGKYILLIKDLDKTLSHEDIDGATITDEEYEKSVDIKKFSRYLIIEKIDDNKPNKIKNETVKENKVDANITNNNVIDDKHKVFVSDGRVQTNPENVYLKDTEVEDVETEMVSEVKPEETTDLKTEIISEIKSEEIVDSKVDVVSEIKSEVIKENIEVKKDDSFTKIENENKKNKKNKSSK